MKRAGIGIILSGIFMVSIVVSVLVLMAGNARRNDRLVDSYITEYEQKLITADLQSRSAGDCVLERTGYGFKATELKTGKVFKVKTTWEEEQE